MGGCKRAPRVPAQVCTFVEMRQTEYLRAMLFTVCTLHTDQRGEIRKHEHRVIAGKTWGLQRSFVASWHEI